MLFIWKLFYSFLRISTLQQFVTLKLHLSYNIKLTTFYIVLSKRTESKKINQYKRFYSNFLSKILRINFFYAMATVTIGIFLTFCILHSIYFLHKKRFLRGTRSFFSVKWREQRSHLMQDLTSSTHKCCYFFWPHILKESQGKISLF